MFKTIQECAVELISATRQTDVLDGSNMDFMPVTAARVSFNRDDRTGVDVERDRKLMSFLAEHKHMTPFEYQHATFHIECPLFIRSQIHRHRTFSYNEISRRYTSDNLEFWIPDVVHAQSTSNKQGSEGEISDHESFIRDGFVIQAKEALQQYEALISLGVAREQARAILPQSLLTRFYMGGNLRNWAHFLELRLDPHAQYEVRVIARKIQIELMKLWPESMRALNMDIV